MDFPDDADGDALRRHHEIGSDLSRPMTIDFTVDVPTDEAGRAVAQAAAGVGYRVEVVYDAGEEAGDDEQEDTGSWTCYCTRDMIASYEAVVAAQEELDRLSAPYGGSCDGWGSFGNAASR